MECANIAATLDKRKNGILVSAALLGVLVGATATLFGDDFLFALANVSFIGFDDFISTAKRGKILAAHGLSDTMGEKPGALVGDFENAVELMGAHAFLGTAHQMHGLNAFMKRQAHMLEDRADLHGELFAAVIAFLEADTVSLALERLDAIGAAAMRAYRTVRPNDGLQKLKSGGFVVEVWAERMDIDALR